jgi:hypothetical protein
MFEYCFSNINVNISDTVVKMHIEKTKIINNKKIKNTVLTLAFDLKHVT